MTGSLSQTRGRPEPGRELDALIAEKVFGVECGHTVEKVPLDELIRRERAEFLEEYGQEAPPSWTGQARWLFEEADYPPRWCAKCHTKGAVFSAPPYSTDIAAAWKVVEKVMESAWSFEARCNHESLPRFAFVGADGWGFSREGSTLPHAICLAALAALSPADDGGRDA